MHTASRLLADNPAETPVSQGDYKRIALTPAQFLLQFEYDDYHEMPRLSGGPDSGFN